MHNIFEVWLGTDRYSFDDPPYNYKHQVNVPLEDVQFWCSEAEKRVNSGDMLWYLATLLEFDPQTGEHKVTTWHKATEVKQKIVLNTEAKQDKKKIAIEKILVTLDDWLDAQDAAPDPVMAKVNGEEINVNQPEW